MLSPLHVALTEMIRLRPELASDLLSDVLHHELPEHDRAQLAAADVVPTVTELAADAVIVFERAAEPIAAVVIETQRRPEPDKRWSWPVYLASVRHRHQCPTVLLVLATDTATARWAATPIDLDGRGSQVRPAVLGLDLLPVVTDPARAARSPELAALGVIAHPDEVSREDLRVLTTALDTIEVGRAVDYIQLVLTALPGPPRAFLEEIMATQTFRYESEFTRRLRDEGRAEGAASVVLRLLARRGLDVPEAARSRIATCTDLDQLQVWAVRAIDATTVDDLFS